MTGQDVSDVGDGRSDEEWFPDPDVMNELTENALTQPDHSPLMKYSVLISILMWNNQVINIYLCNISIMLVFNQTVCLRTVWLMFLLSTPCFFSNIYLSLIVSDALFVKLMYNLFNYSFPKDNEKNITQRKKKQRLRSTSGQHQHLEQPSTSTYAPSDTDMDDFVVHTQHKPHKPFCDIVLDSDDSLWCSHTLAVITLD